MKPYCCSATCSPKCNMLSRVLGTGSIVQDMSTGPDGCCMYNTIRYSTYQVICATCLPSLIAPTARSTLSNCVTQYNNASHHITSPLHDTLSSWYHTVSHDFHTVYLLILQSTVHNLNYNILFLSFDTLHSTVQFDNVQH